MTAQPTVPAAALRGEKILVTGPAGRVAFPLAVRLARDQEVWGIARFSQAAERVAIEAAGIRTRRVDLADPDWVDLPDDFTLVLHFAAAIGTTLSFADAVRINGVGTGRLMHHFRAARACLVASSRAVYAEPVDPDRIQHESDPLGGVSPLPYSPSYRVSKLAQEAVAQFWAQELSLPTIITRLNVVYGDNGGLPAMIFDLMKAGKPIPLGPHGATRAAPIHHDDLFDQLPGLLAGASVPATIVNWAGDEPVSMRELCEAMGRLTGLEPKFVVTDAVSGNRPSDPVLRQRLAGPCRVDWRDGIRRMLEALYPADVARAKGRADQAR
jgi:nucleoside-diphosphate-sugar epimerase